MTWDENKRQELLTQYQNKVNEYNTLKNKKINGWSIALYCYPIFCIILAIILYKITNNEFIILLFIFFLLGGSSIILFGREIYNRKKNKQLTKLKNEIAVINSNGYAFISEYLCNLLNINSVMLLDELNLLSNSYSALLMKSGITYNFWQNVDCINGVQDLLSRKFKGIDFDNKSQDLKLENLKLQNESIAIDNTQKKFWTCQFCGNMNRADDMSCIKCGGIRPSSE